ncbi:tRNA (adenine(37)-N6)-methyltransferase [Pseudidiomarina piscicola]|uniref:tRNA (Adenine(37)-N6)-methyltransferase n=1 Tax=Pseudidiomarina piscicola TaxID=2614830 RepID=A0A6S6WM26_9GAMM|nr:tRNA (N6-threonylcarbamoyladenosine(37)-N6)-methyltransferase TrmO [Pseudidiomarina piscicola]CAB0149773.1 tRNA (adenine(37)-N6)-methyltransferase [Pseudidiomarina piscicola]VZT39221.1 tRNA (adenine(37)-N6)-methyltransferase [Pseudomonas aeruginosa]
MIYSIEPIGEIRSPYSEKFAVPRQPGLVTAAKATVVLDGSYAGSETTRGLAQFSHIWVLFLFHHNLEQGWQPLVRPPRLGGNQKLGVFATRSTFRPNGIGMSVVKLLDIEQQAEQTLLHVEGGDWVNGTPVVDIKPYVPYADAIPEAQAGFAQEPPAAAMPVIFTSAARQSLQQLAATYPQLELLITQVLQGDPRPAYQQLKPSNKLYGVRLYDLNVQWRVENNQNHVINISKAF